MKYLLSFFAFILFATVLHAQDDLLRRALDGFGLDSSTVGYRPQQTWDTAPRDDPFRLPYFDELLARPLKIPNFTQRMLWRYNVYATADSSNMAGYHSPKVRPLAMMVLNSARNLGYDVGKYGLDYTPQIAETNPVLAEIRAVYENNNRTLGDMIVYPLPTQHWSDIAGEINKQLEGMPEDFQRAVAEILAASREAARWRNASLDQIPREDWHHIYSSTTLEESQCDAHTFDQKVYDAAVAFNGKSCYYGALLLAQAVQKAMPVIERYKKRDFTFDLATPQGRIFIAGAAHDTHYAQDCLLSIDLAGNDRYFGSVAATAPERPISILIDVDGKDRYENTHKGAPAQGAGILGIAMLIDTDENDTYESKTFSQGCGRFGVGILYDVDGNDSYTSEGFSQGAGMYGQGILLDQGGDDVYTTVYYAQGYGFSKGLGLLMDVSGDDTYTALDDELTHVGDETPKHNESDAQGFGSGRRGDHVDGHNMSGGLGILNDLDGDDTYSAGVFAQGSSYWFGYGILNDAKGNDSYRGVFFNLGAAAHFGIGTLFDGSGDDKSELVMTLGFGTGHDGSAAFYIDTGGDDSYTMTAADDRAVSLGSSLNSSFSMFLNVRGNDTYEPVGKSYGYVSGRRTGEWAQYGPTTGVFLDIGGTDSYNQPQAGQNTEWNSTEIDIARGLYSIGIDTEQGSVKFEE